MNMEIFFTKAFDHGAFIMHISRLEMMNIYLPDWEY